jgi:hypothetical protein
MRPSPTADERPVLARNRTSQGFYRCSFIVRVIAYLDHPIIARAAFRATVEQ